MKPSYTTDDLIEMLNRGHLETMPIDAAFAIIVHLKAGDRLAVDVIHAHEQEGLDRAVEKYRNSCEYPEEDIGERKLN
jgi:autonomous glycyl radical cofactor GrcA